MSAEATRFPLSWPVGWKRTSFRHHAKFGRAGRHDGTVQGYVAPRRLTVSEGLARLNGELGRLGASKVVISTNVTIRLDGLPYSNQPEPRDPGVAVYFSLSGKPRCLACDRWARVADNLAAVAAHVAAIRAVDRYGVGTLDQAFAGYAQLPPAATEWWTVLGVSPNATREVVDIAYRGLAKQHHPDLGGSPEFMARINAARDEAIKSLEREGAA